MHSFLRCDKVGVQSLNIFNSFFNISAAYGNNNLSFPATDTKNSFFVFILRPEKPCFSDLGRKGFSAQLARPKRFFFPGTKRFFCPAGEKN